MGLLKKLGRGIKKGVRKIVPKELSGIMRVAAPFVAASNPLAGIGLSVAGQLRSERGRVSPLETILAAAPSKQFRAFTTGEFDVPDALEEKIFGKGNIDIFGNSALGEKLMDMGRGVDKFLYGMDKMENDVFKPRGILGAEGEFNPFKGSIILDKEGSPKLGNIFALLGAGLSFAQAKKAIRREGEDLGLEDDEIVDLEGQLLDNYFPGFDPTGFRPDVPGKKDGGLMRKNLAMGSGDELPPDPTKPIGVPPGFKPKPIGPVLPNKAEASPMSILNDMAIQLFGKPLDQLDDRQKEMIMSFMKPKAQQGGLMRTNYALGSMPTKEESGLGGLPIEADMRYTGGFMPYGAKEKADDVPARLSKNEFVFTADAVRAAGGGSVQKGAQKMYNSMKQLESMGRRMA
jgi:hypothetical protein